MSLAFLACTVPDQTVSRTPSIETTTPELLPTLATEQPTTPTETATSIPEPEQIAETPATVVETATITATPTNTQEPEATLIPTSQPAVAASPEPSATPDLHAPPAHRGELVIHHIDVGQADATLIQAPGATILIDAGDFRRSDVVPYLRAAGVSHIDLLILTHPHADHIGQVPQVMAAFSVVEVWMPGWEHSTQTFERAIDAILQSEAGYHEPRAGETVQIGSITVAVVHPVDPLQDIHDNIAVRIVFGEFAALYTGDAEIHHELEMIQRGHNLRAQVLQLGHHGSRTSSATAFLQAVGAEVAVYSAGSGNQFGHPHSEVVDRITSMGIELYGTDVHGTVLVISDGTNYRVEVGRSRPTIVEPQQPVPTETITQINPSCVDINTASLAELQRISHIGLQRANQILALRPFSSVDDMIRIQGIGSARLHDIKQQGVACVR